MCRLLGVAIPCELAKSMLVPCQAMVAELEPVVDDSICEISARYDK
jgi:hypothetical protein